MKSDQAGTNFDDALLTPGYLANPYPYYEALRMHDPVYWSARLNAWVLTRFRDVSSALRNPKLMSGQRVATYASTLPPESQEWMKPLFDQVGGWMGNMDPPDHTRLRRLVNVAFTPSLIESLRPDIERTVNALLDKMEAQGDADFIADFAYPLPAIVIAQMLGVPDEDQDRFMRWSDDLTAYAGTGKPDLETARRASDSAEALTLFFKELTQQRRVDPRDDLISQLVALEEEGDKLTEQELFSMCGFLLVAGHETTMALLGNGLLALLRHPDQLQKLRDDPTIAQTAVEELLRFDGPIQHQTRVAAQDMQIEDKQIREGDRLILFIGSADRDAAQFPDPDHLDLERSPNRHVAFGMGIHFCLGAPLARFEALIAFPMILKRFSKIELRCSPEELRWRHHTSNRNNVALPVRVG